jgi:hypothetical protein
MKEYIIWLKSGECIKGTIEDEGVLFRKGLFNLKFSDTEGTVTIKRHRIEAIAVNNIIETNKCGF